MTAGDTGSRMNKGGMMKNLQRVSVVITIGFLAWLRQRVRRSAQAGTDYRNGGLTMKTSNNLKPVPSGKKGKGLGMLKKVRA